MIWLVGMMGAGKSAVGGAVATLVGLPHVDMDAEIERRTGSSIARLFESVGEPTFRLFEAALVTELARGARAVVSTGGGAVLDEASVAAMRSSGCVVWLTAAPATLADRVGDGADRPLIGSADAEGTLAELLEKRAPLYEAAAHHRVATADRGPAEIAEEVVELCNPA